MPAQATRRRIRVLSISDEVALQRLIRAVLSTAQPGHFAVAPIGLDQFAGASETADIVIVDLPRIHGESLAPIRDRFPGAEIIALSEAYHESDAILAIDAGVECLARPFREAELLSTVRKAELRVHQARGAPRHCRIGEAMYDTLEGRLLFDAASVDLSDAEAAVLVRLTRAQGKVVAFAELLSALGRRRDDALGRQRVRSVIWALRRKLGRGLSASPVESEPHVGYRLRPHARVQTDDDQRTASEAQTP